MFDRKLFNDLMYYFMIEEPRRRSMGEDEDQIEDEVDSNELWRELVYKASEMVVHFGLFNAVTDTFPPHVKEGLIERMQAMLILMEKEVEIIQGFGEYFDEPST
jgi:hypothetical protein